MTHLTTATITCPIACDQLGIYAEASVAFLRANRFLTHRGIQRMIDRGCEETDNVPRPDMSVVRIETAYLS